MSELDRRIAPPGHAEPAVGFADTVMREEVVGVRDLERDDLQLRLGVDRLNEVEDLVVH